MRTRPAFTYATLAAATLLVASLLRYPSLFEPRWYGDEGIFAAVAQNIRHGETLYADAWDNKPPLIFFTYAAIQSTLGSGVFALHFVATVSVLATQAAVMAIALRLFGPRRSLVAGLIFAFAMGTPLLEANLAMTETFMILPASLAVLAYLLAERRDESARTPWYAAAGVLLGIAAGYKQVAVFDGAAIAAMIWITHERPLRALAPIAAGFAAPQIAFAALFLASGAFPQYWYAVAGSLRLYAELGPAQSPFVRFIGFLPALMACAWLVRRRQLGREVRLSMFPMLWLGFAIAGATSSSFPFPHYLQQAIPALALVFVADPLGQEREDVGKIALAVGGVLVAAVVFGQFAFAYKDRPQLDPLDYYRTFVQHRYGTMSYDDYVHHFDGKVFTVHDIAMDINRDGAGTTLYTWSELPWLYADANLTNPTRYYTSFLGEFIPGAKQEILRDLDARPPVYIVVSDKAYGPFRELDAFVAARYALIDARNDWRLYRLLTAHGRLTPERSLRAVGRRHRTVAPVRPDGPRPTPPERDAKCAADRPPTAYPVAMGIISRILGWLARRPDAGAPVRLPSPDELVLLARPHGEPEAQLLRQMLAAEGIHAMVKNRDAVSAESGGMGPPWAYELWVLRRDVRRSREIIGDDEAGAHA